MESHRRIGADLGCDCGAACAMSKTRAAAYRIIAANALPTVVGATSILAAGVVVLAEVDGPTVVDLAALAEAVSEVSVAAFAEEVSCGETET